MLIGLLSSLYGKCSSSKMDTEVPPLQETEDLHLGSVVQLRTSARVSKKLKLDQEASIAALAASEKKDEKGDCSEEPKHKNKRTPFLWSPDDKSAFFEALNEHGKNFDAIEKYMSTRAKKRGEHGPTKNKHRARHFYYRTWLKISKHVHFPDTVPKVTQELYALINFGEFRKKVGYVTEKNSQKLNELIYSGFTQVRVRGKAWRIKTPVCRALRKLNHFEDDCEDFRLPSRVEVLVRPRSNRDSARIQSLAHNPILRTTLALDSSIDCLKAFLQNRWWNADNPPPAGEVFKLGPKKAATGIPVTFKCGKVASSGSVSLMAHEKRLGGIDAYEKIRSMLASLQVGKTKSMLKWQKEDYDDNLNSNVVDPNEEIKKYEDVREKSDSEESVDRVQIGQLYIAYGGKGVLELEYWWESLEEDVEFAQSLKRLVSIAKLFHHKVKVECPCGHLCKTLTKPKVVKTRNENGQEAKIPQCFKQPLLLPRPGQSTVQPQQHQILPKYCSRRGRSKQRSVIVQRMLPLLPKTPNPVMLLVPASTPVSVQDTCQPSFKNDVINANQSEESPMEMEKVDIPCSSQTFSGILGDMGEGPKEIPPSPSPNLLQDIEGTWLSSDMNDISLSSFFNHLDSPLKTNPNEDTHMSTEVESHLQSLMTESSLDYTAKFADLAAKIVDCQPASDTL